LIDQRHARYLSEERSLEERLERIDARLESVPRYLPKAWSKAVAGHHVPRPRLSANESPVGPSARVLRELAAAVEQSHRYPIESGVQAAIARRWDLPADRFLLTNGSDELSYLIGSVFIEPGDVVVLGDPPFPIHDLVTRLNRAVPRYVPLVDGRHDLAAMLDACGDAAVVWLPNPHNPTGGAVDPDDLCRFVEEAPEACIVVVDEAYRAFMDDAAQPPTGLLARRHDNLLIQRTFSKDHAMAGLRLGYGVASPKVIELLSVHRPPFSVNVAALAAAQAAEADPAFLRRIRDSIRRERGRLQRFLDEIGLPYLPSQANFVTVRFGDALDDVLDELEERGVPARDGRGLGMPGWARVTVGSADEMAALRDGIVAAVSAPQRSY
jgi:histidinol-phosphate aminotransferase